MTYADGYLYVVEGFGAKSPGIDKIKLSDNYSKAKIVNKLESDQIDVPTSIAVVKGDLYVVNSQFEHLFAAKKFGPSDGDFKVSVFKLM